MRNNKEFLSETDIEQTICRYELETDEGGTPREKAIRMLQAAQKKTKEILREASRPTFDNRLKLC